ncbi:hypothetical protein [Hymenobacter sp. GOD-10R]|uniref:hypothetical protein n=1 Tax=Hymenobacter sp. GOD-10R TaxID=3093922 RepID=UPI002D76E549|nr:hypothetical protein [Hymenobacter sp. GOD-10R]WRQ27079.1 hypothetical protein SD425_18560 [Hymenobacter sp. GOD-10R]
MEPTTLPLPTVPEVFRTAHVVAPTASLQAMRSTRKILRSLGAACRRMQAVIMLRCQRAGTVAFVHGSWANANEWQLLLAEVDQALAALRAAWQELKDTEHAVQEVCRTWRATHGIPADFHLHEDTEEFWLLYWPAVQAARSQSDALIDTAVRQWGAASTTYLRLLQSSYAKPRVSR